MKGFTARTALYLGISMMALCGHHAQAQEADAANQANDTGISDIIVTAQKRSERLQDVPIAITAVDSATLTSSGVTNIDGLQRLAPGLSIANVGSGFVSYTYLRGAGTNVIDSGADPSVAYYIDEVYLGSKAGLQFDLLDVDRVEVLKGPQGTLFGRNAEGGAISVSTKRPTSTLSAHAYGEAGNHGIALLRGSVSGPLVNDNLLFRLSLGTKRTDPFTQNLAGGRDPGGYKSYAGRGQIEYRGGRFTARLTGEALKLRGGMTNSFFATSSKAAYVSAAAAAALPPGDSFYKHYYNVNGFERQNSRSLTGRIEWDSPIGQITSISAYRFDAYRRLQDQDSTIADGFELGSNERTKTYSQELRLSSAIGERFDYTFGVYYYHAKINTLFDLYSGADFPAVALQRVRRQDRALITTNSYAVFGQGTLKLTDELSLTAGGRYTSDKKDNDRSLTTNGVLIYRVNPGDTWHSFDPSVTLNYKPTSDIMLYASFRQGFKSGGFQALAPATAAIANTPFLPETLRSYEIGLKSTLFDRRLVFNMDIFRADITDQQISRVTTSTVILVDNAGATRTNGVEVSIVAQPIQGLRLGLDATYQEARFRQYLNGAISYAGNHQLRSPDFMLAANAEYNLDLPGGSTITPRVDYSYRTVQYFDAANAVVGGVRIANQYQPAYGLGNASITFSPASRRFTAGLWVRNIANKRYYRNLVTIGLSGLATPGDPRTIGASLDLNF